MEQKKKIWIIAGSVIGALVVIYLGGSIYFMSHFHFGTKIGDVVVSGQSAAKADETLQQAMKDYVLSVKERDGGIDTIVGKDIDLSISWTQKPESFIEAQNGFEWIFKVFQADTYEISGTFFYDETKLAEKMNHLTAMSAAKQIAAVDAKISEYDVQNGYVLVPSIPGTEVNAEIFLAQIKDCIINLNSELDMVTTGCYVEPMITDDNEKLLAAIEQLNKSLSTVITYQVGSSTQTLDATVFQPWLMVNENFEVFIDDTAVTDYVKSLASTYNTYGIPKNLMTSYGKAVTIKRSEYGWKIDNTKEKEAIITEIIAGEPVSRDFNYEMKANSRGSNDYGNSYVEINLTAQHLFLYVDGKKILETDFVSGNLAKNNGSPTGAFSLTYRARDVVLRGRDYETPVSYWMPFAGNVGMHDAYWRKDFGGSIYKRDGSHGCINLPPEKAKQIFDYVKKGFPVLVYTLDGTQSAKGDAQDQAYIVNDAIKAIGPVTLQSEAAIVACRAQYDALSDMAKQYVKNYNKLVEAENALATLKLQAGV